jgi:exosortase A-associated hydrolase 1
MRYTEYATTFACNDQTLVGIVACPESPGTTGVVLIVGGPQTRVGSHRQFVLLSRALAQAGYPVLRFDYRGMGDSTGEPRDFEAVSGDVAVAIDALQAHQPSVTQIVLWGLCDGAAAALLYCHDKPDPRVTGLCLLNPWLRSPASLAKTQVKHYYTQRLQQKEFWLKLLSGKVALTAVSGFVQKLRQSATGASAGKSATSPHTFQQRMAAAWHGFPGHILLILSGDDYTAKEFLEHASAAPAWKNFLNHAKLHRHDLPGVDHTFSSAASRKLAEGLLIDWLSDQR